MTVEEVTDPLDALGVIELLGEDTGRLDALLTARQLDAETAEHWLRVLRDLRAVIEQLRTLDAGLVKHIYLTAEHGKQVIDGIGEVWVARGKDRKKWDERGVAQAVLDHQMGERGGELPNDPWEVAQWLLDVLHVDYARVTPLRGMGLDPDVFCEVVTGKPSVTLPPPD